MGRPGRMLSGSLHHPGSGRGDGLGVVICHGMLSDRSSEKHVALSIRSADLGLTALRFDFAGRGDSEGGPEDLTIGGEVADCRGALTALRSRGLDGPVLVGSSLGGTVSLLAAAEDQRVAGLVTMAAPSKLPEGPRSAWGESAREVPETFYEEARRHDLEEAARSITCPWLILHGASDEVVPVSHAQHLDASGRGRLVIRAGGDHRFASPGGLEWLLATVTGFLEDLV